MSTNVKIRVNDEQLFKKKQSVYQNNYFLQKHVFWFLIIFIFFSYLRLNGNFTIIINKIPFKEGYKKIKIIKIKSEKTCLFTKGCQYQAYIHPPYYLKGHAWKLKQCRQLSFLSLEFTVNFSNHQSSIINHQLSSWMNLISATSIRYCPLFL